jgi:hypothetical protein
MRIPIVGPVRRPRAAARRLPLSLPADRDLATAGRGPAAATDLDTTLHALHAALVPHRRHLWTRRVVRRAWLAVAIALLAEAVLWAIARLAPLELAPAIAVAIAAVAGAGLLVEAIRQRRLENEL